MSRSPYFVIALGFLVMGYAVTFHVDLWFAGQLITKPIVFAGGLLIAVLGACEALADAELGERG